MKTLKTIALICCLAVIFSCSRNKAPDLSGLYVNQAEGEYSIASDTLIISVINLENKVYQIENKVGYNRIKNKVILPKQYKTERWEAIWDAEKRVLSENDLGRQIRIAPDGKDVAMKTTEFRKIK
jgi:hypothetical protein